MNALRSILRSRHFWGVLGTGVVMYLIFFVLLARVNVGWLMPDTQRMARNLIVSWPQLPFFAVTKHPAADGNGEVISYTVPTRQFTHQELIQMGVTNASTTPAAPRK